MDYAAQLGQHDRGMPAEVPAGQALMEKAMRLGFHRHAEMAWIDDYLAAWNDHDPAAVTDFMTNDVVYTDFGLGEEFNGIEAVREFVEGMEIGFSTDYRFRLEQAIVTPEAYSYEWTMTGTNDREDAERDFPATGMRFEIPGVSIGVLRNGKIKDNRDYWNMSTYLMQVGLEREP
ncbi:MAG: nuclear transport factor 2 family protein [Pseudonocardiaceae bacterium]